MFKNATLFAIMATVVLSVISIFTYHVFIVIIGTDLETTAVIASIISAIIVVVLDFKVFHFRQKMRQRISNSLG